MSLAVTQLIHGKNKEVKGVSMDDFINNLAYELFSVLLVVFVVVVLYVIIRRRYPDYHERDN